MELVSLVVAAIVALADVVTTKLVLKKYGFDKEQNVLLKPLYKKIPALAPVIHAALWAGFLSLPWIFASGGILIGNIMFIILVGISVNENIKNLNA